MTEKAGKAASGYEKAFGRVSRNGNEWGVDVDSSRGYDVTIRASQTRFRFTFDILKADGNRENRVLVHRGPEPFFQEYKDQHLGQHVWIWVVYDATDDPVPAIRYDDSDPRVIVLYWDKDGNRGDVTIVAR